MPDSHVFVVFGATGDLMHRKLLPALRDLLSTRNLEGQVLILGTSRSALTDDTFRDRIVQSLVQDRVPHKEAVDWSARHIFFQTLGDQTREDFLVLRKRIEALETEYGLPGNRVFYLALPPDSFVPTIEHLGKAGLNKGERGWARLVIEKPFGQDLESAVALNKLIHRYFEEDQIYRIDHYLGKETVQNLMVFRFGNALFESMWNREHIEQVDMLVSESLGVEGRAGYFDHVGTLRDMIQNHVTQLLSLLAMEVPATADAEAIRHEKIKVLQSIQPIEPSHAIFGQYTRGVFDSQPIAGYREEEGVSSDSSAETYVALPLSINNWRWQGVPFIVQCGKRMPRRLTRIAVTFRRPPVMLFRSYSECHLNPNVLLMTLQPDEGFSLSFEVKKPGNGFNIDTQQLRFKYQDAFGSLPDAYRTLLEDVARGDQTLFVHADEAETSWKLYTPLLNDRPPVHFYAAGTWGPPEAGRVNRTTPGAIYE